MELSSTRAREIVGDVGTLWTVQRLGYRARCALVARRSDWELCVLVDGTPLLTERCDRDAEAFAVAESLKQRMLRDGWEQVIPRPHSPPSVLIAPHATGVPRRAYQRG